MCLAIPGQVVEIIDAAARTGRVDVLGRPRVVNLGLVEDIAPGDWVLVHMGVAVQRMDEAEARETVRLFEELESVLVESLAAGEEATS
jgi:hydrogenase expression/formation protein HypC